MHERIVILDFGSQVTKLIARRVRESGVYSEIHPCTIPVSEVEALEPHGIILSGGPNSVFDTDAPQIDPKLLDMERGDGSQVPVLGICYGLQAMAHLLGGTVEGAERREFGRAQLFLATNTGLFENVEDGSTVWTETRANFLLAGDGEPTGILGITRDISERRRAEEERRRMEQQIQLTGRLAAVGELAAGVAHELNNPLAAVQGFAQLLASRSDLDETVKEDVDTIRTDIEDEIEDEEQGGAE